MPPPPLLDAEAAVGVSGCSLPPPSSWSSRNFFCLMTRPDLLVGWEDGVPISARCLAGGGVAAGVSSAFLLAPRAERAGGVAAGVVGVLANIEAADLAMAEAAADFVDADVNEGVPDARFNRIKNRPKTGPKNHPGIELKRITV